MDCLGLRWRAAVAIVGAVAVVIVSTDMFHEAELEDALSRG